MTQAKSASITGGLLFVFAAWFTTFAMADHGYDQQAWEQWHSRDFTAKRMFVGDRASNGVDAYDRKGNWIFDLTADGLIVPFGVDVDDGNIYVVSQGTNEVYAYLRDGNRSQHRDHTEEVPQLELLVQAGSGGLQKPFYTTIEDDMLYVSSHDTDEVLRYDAETGEFIDVAVTAGAGGLDGPRGLDFDSRGRLYVASSLGNEVIVYNRHGDPVGHMAKGILAPCGVSISRHDEICVGASGGGGVHCYDPEGNEIYSDTAGKVCGLDFGPRGNLYTTRGDLSAVTVHSLRPGTQGEWFSDANLPSGLSWGE
jgi:DNA-binding beta-propeller fold protein YncE